tara:strand:- start:83 stop:559 length:477 start_codon:yes stop_codon:yes gene_type:complete
MSEKTIAWAWVLEHASLIRGIVNKQASGTGIDADDLHGDVIVRIVEKWDKYDSSRSSASTWVWWQCLAVRKSMVKQRSRPFVEIKETHRVENEAATSLVQIKEIRRLATEDEWRAVLFMAQGFDGEKLGQLCECAPFSARRRASRLRQKYTGLTAERS